MEVRLRHLGFLSKQPQMFLPYVDGHGAAAHPPPSLKTHPTPTLPLPGSDLNAHLFLFIFLPPLIYESASTIDFHVSSRSFPQILLLAGPGVLLSSALSATVAVKVLGYG
jgi:hypothetical protein